MKEQIEKEIKELNEQMSVLQSQLKPLQEKKSKLVKEHRLLALKEALPLTPEKVANSNYQMFDFDEGFKELRKYMSQFKTISCDGFWSHTQKKALKIAFDQNKDFESQKNEVLLFLSAMPYDDFDKDNRIDSSKINLHKVKVFSIFEYSLSEDGVFNLVVDEKNEAALINTYYSSSRIVKTLPFEEMLNYIYENRPYQRRDD
jgi:hypothetical protein